MSCVTRVMCCVHYRIPDEKDPKDRIIAIVRYYLSAFHAARKVGSGAHT